MINKIIMWLMRISLKGSVWSDLENTVGEVEGFDFT